MLGFLLPIIFLTAPCVLSERTTGDNDKAAEQL